MTAYQSQTKAIFFSHASLPTATLRRFSDDFASVTDVTPFSLVSYHRYDVLYEIFSKISGSWLSRLCGIIDVRKLGQRSLMSSKRSRRSRICEASHALHAKDVSVSCRGDLEKLHITFSVGMIVSTRERWRLEWRQKSDGGLR